MAKYRQYDNSPAYLDGISVAHEQLSNKGMGYPVMAPSLPRNEQQDFWRGYHETVKEAVANFH